MSPVSHVFRVIRHPRAEVLAAELGQRLADTTEGLDPFVPIAIAVDAPPTGAWLRDMLAARFGIAAQFEFPLAGRAIEDGLQRLTGVDPDPALPDPWHKLRLLWPLLDVIDSLLGDDGAAPALRDYLGSARDAEGRFVVNGRTFSLATRIADATDRYVVHRSRKVAGWLQTLGYKPSPNAHPSESWQAEILRRLAARIGPPGARLLAAGTLPPPPKPLPIEPFPPRPLPLDLPPLRIFGLTGLPRTVLFWLWAEAHVRDVEIYLRAPTAEPLELMVDDHMTGQMTGHPADDRHNDHHNDHHFDDGQFDDDYFALVDTAEDDDGDGDDGASSDIGIAPDASPPFRDDVPAYAAPAATAATPSPTVSGPLTGIARLLRELGAQALDFERDLMALDSGDVDATGLPAIFGDHRLPPWFRAFGRPQVEIDMPFDDSHAPPHKPSLLQQLQHHILHASDPASPLPVDPRDDSIEFHVCHGPMRQAEVLRDVLLRILDRDPSLEPRDMLVFTPDIETHAPLLEAAFAAGGRTDTNTPLPRLPLRVIGRSVRRTNPFADILARLLALGSGRLTIADILELLALGPVRRRFRIAESDLGRVRNWLVESGARWGLDAASRTAFHFPEVSEHTIVFGIDRLAIGHLLAEDAALVDLGIPGLSAPLAPMGGLEGGDIAPLGGLLACLEALSTWLPRIASDGRGHTVAAWVSLLSGSDDAVFSPEHGGLLGTFADPGEAAWQWDEVVSGLRALRDEAAETTARLLPEAFIAALEARFDTPVKGTLGSPAAAGVTLAAMGLAAGLPSRVVVLFGLDDDTFPAVGERPGFDLLAYRPRPGDPDPRRHQRQTFLDALLQAGERLIVTWTGRDGVTDKKVAPAIVVTELLEAIDTAFAAPSARMTAVAHLTREHPLQPFSERNFSAAPDAPGRGEPFSHDARLVEAVLMRRQRGLPGDQAATDDIVAGPWVFDDAAEVTIPLDEIERDLSRPSAAFFRHTLKVHQRGPEIDPVPEREPLHLRKEADGGSDAERNIWQLALFDGPRLRPELPPVTAVVDHFRAAGALPEGLAGRRLVADLMGDATIQRDTAVAEMHGEVPPLHDCAASISLAVAKASAVPGIPLPARLRVTANVGGLARDRLVGLVKSDADYAHLQWWLSGLMCHLDAAVPSPAMVTVFGAIKAGNKKREPSRLTLTLPSEASMQAQLFSDLCLIALVARRTPLPLFRRSSRTFVKTLVRSGTLTQALLATAMTTTAGPWAAVLFDQLEAAGPDAVQAAFDAALRDFQADDNGFEKGPPPDADDTHVATLFPGLESLDDRREPRAGPPPGSGRDWGFAGLALRVWGPILVADAKIAKSKEDA